MEHSFITAVAEDIAGIDPAVDEAIKLFHENSPGAEISEVDHRVTVVKAEGKILITLVVKYFIPAAA